MAGHAADWLIGITTPTPLMTTGSIGTSSMRPDLCGGHGGDAIGDVQAASTRPKTAYPKSSGENPV